MAALSAASSAAAAVAASAPRPHQPQQPPLLRRSLTRAAAGRPRRPRLVAPAAAASSSAPSPATDDEPSSRRSASAADAAKPPPPPRQAGRVRSVTAREACEMAGLGPSASGGGSGRASGGGSGSSDADGDSRGGSDSGASAWAAPGGAAAAAAPPPQTSTSGAERWTLLDVRPPHERLKVPIEGAAPAPFFVADPDGGSLAGLLRAAASFGMGGWWLGAAPLVPNPAFLDEAAAALPGDRQSARVVVACQKGLRSLAACEALIRAGYPHVAWVSGGLDSAFPGDLPTPGGKDVRYAGIGGASEALGWTEVQREARRARRGGAPSDLGGVFALAGAVLAADLLLFAYEHWASTHPGWPMPFRQ